MNKRKTGGLYEQKAAHYLEQCGYQIIEMNFRCPQGEIDLIAKDKSYLVFIEVKFRNNMKDGSGLEAVDYRKQQRIKRTALWYLTKMHYSEQTPCRFDVISYQGEDVVLIKNAFE